MTQAEPLQFAIRIQDFDLGLLPIDERLLKSDPDMLRQAVTDFFTAEFKKIGGRAEIVARDDRVDVRWYPDSRTGHKAIVEYATGLLRQGAYKHAEPLLRAILQRFPDDADTLLNYGMMLSDQKRLDDAIRLLAHAIELMPDSAPAWNAMGLARQRNGDSAAALDAFRKSHSLDPANPDTLKNLGVVVMEGDAGKALPLLERAAGLLPKDQQAAYGHAACLYKMGRMDEADREIRRALGIAPHTELAERCRALLTEMAHAQLRERNVDGLRPDVVMYCLAAIRKYAEVGQDEMRRITFEIAFLGRNGLDINDPAAKYRLKALPGEFSGLQLLSYMYVGFQLVSPGQDIGVDFGPEYEEARRREQESKNGLN